MNTSVNDQAAKPFVLFMLPPPMLFGIAFGAGALLQSWLPIPATRPAVPALFYAGSVLLVAGVLTGALLASGFLRRRTTLNPFGNPSLLIERGPYRLSRNPMYVALAIAYLGGVLLLGSVWPLLTLLGPIVILNRVVIPFEEASMAARFGHAYQDYCTRVRRWV